METIIVEVLLAFNFIPKDHTTHQQHLYIMQNSKKGKRTRGNWKKNWHEIKLKIIARAYLHCGLNSKLPEAVDDYIIRNLSDPGGIIQRFPSGARSFELTN